MKTFLTYILLLPVLLLLPLLLNGEDKIKLATLMEDAVPGDYIVSVQNKTYTLLHIFEKRDKHLILEEISIPEQNVRGISWREWIQKGAHGHSSWVIFEIDLSSGEISEFYSFSQKAWINIAPSDNILATLLQINLEKIPSYQRKQKGSRSKSTNSRDEWDPPLYYEGNRVADVIFDGWRARWPRNGSELGGKTIVLYLPSEKGDFLSYFPYWLEVIGGGSRAKLRVKDSGHALRSPTAGLPRRHVRVTTEKSTTYQQSYR
jgi:hypothetical protein